MVYRYYRGARQNSISNASLSIETPSEKTPLCSTTVSITDNEQRTYCGICKPTSLFCLYLICYAVFLIAGAAVFNTLEAPEEENLILRLRKLRQQFLVDNPGVSGRYKMCNDKQRVIINSILKRQIKKNYEECLAFSLFL